METSRAAMRCRSLVRTAKKNGKLIVPLRCEVCGKDPSEEPDPMWREIFKPTPLVAHHWRGYEYPLDVWWVCSSCNRELEGQHSGLLKNVTEAFYYVKEGGYIADIPEKYRFVIELRRETYIRMRKQKGY